MPGKDTNIGAKRAREARARWGLPDDDALPCVVAVAEHCAQLPVVVAPLPGDWAGALHPTGLMWVNGRHAAVRMRFTVAHELGHHCCGHPAPTLDTVADLSAPGTPHEVQANAFAAELLAPEPAVVAMVEGRPTLEDVVRVAVRFGISCASARFRLVTLGLASPARAEALAGEQDEGLHHPLLDRHGREPADLLGQLEREDLPRVPPALRATGLGALLRGEADPATVAHAAGVRSETLADGLTELHRP